VLSVDCSVENVNAIGHRKYVRERAKKYWQCCDRKEKPAQEDHWKTEEVGKGLSLENLAHRNCDEQSEEC
jgi:hypothetical protein